MRTRRLCTVSRAAAYRTYVPLPGSAMPGCHYTIWHTYAAIRSWTGPSLSLSTPVTVARVSALPLVLLEVSTFLPPLAPRAHAGGCSLGRCLSPAALCLLLWAPSGEDYSSSVSQLLAPHVYL